MKKIGIFVAGFATGWAVRSSVDSSRKLAVFAISTAYELSDRARRWIAVEREHIEDLVAEGHSNFKSSKGARQSPHPRQAPHATEMPREHAA